MCGIVVSYRLSASHPVPEPRIKAALQCIAHRGPDDEGLLTIGRATLGQRRLSIIDTSAAGHQPFVDNDGRYSITFNGEVFNFQQLRAGLEAQGHTFRSHTDTEIVLRLFAVKGPAFLHDLNGFFAMAIHDKEKDELFLARDRFGVKPLWWCEANSQFLFSSELRALMQLGAPRELDPLSLHQYFTFQFIPAPNTICQGTNKLLPGHAITVSASGMRMHRWYDPVEASRSTVIKADHTAQLSGLLDDAVRLRLIADVPVGTFLSGGLDSSIISALAKRHHKELHTFSIGFADDPYYDESRHAETVAKHIGSTHTTFKLSREDLAENYSALLDAIDEPFADSSALPNFILAQRTRKHVTVALSGDGADEVFGGYRKHQAELRMLSPGLAERTVIALGPLWRMLPRSRNGRWSDTVRKLHRFAELGGNDAGERWWKLAAQGAEAMRAGLLSLPIDSAELLRRDEALKQNATRLDGMNSALLADVLTVLPDNMLHKVDLTSMAHGLEVRTPFLDKRVVEFAFALPAAAKLRKGAGKYILRDAFGHLLPASTLTRSKQGFDVPLRALFLGPLASTLNTFLDRTLVETAGLSWTAVQSVRKQLTSTSPGEAQATVHALLVYLSWWKRWKA